MTPLRTVLATLAALLLIFATERPDGSGLPVFHGKAQYGLLTAGDGILGVPERAAWKRSQDEGRESVPDDGAQAAHASVPDESAQPIRPNPSVGRSHRGRTVTPPARGPPGPFA
jgi:hypothetical protein